METKTLAHSTAEKLVQYIREQQLAPGAKIPTEYELARMLGGVKITDTVLQNAREMKELAERTKNKKAGKRQQKVQK